MDELVPPDVLAVTGALLAVFKIPFWANGGRWVGLVEAILLSILHTLKLKRATWI